jgi:hypothetical protein
LANSQSNQLISIKDVVGYISDQVRAAATVYDTLTIDGTACTATSTTTPCFGIKQAVLDSSGNPITDSYTVKVYRLRSRSNLSSSYKTASDWADSNTY